MDGTDIGFVPRAAPIVSQGQPQGSDLGFTPDDQTAAKEEIYGTPEQQLKTALEGAGRGLTGPAAPYLEKKLGVKPEDIRARQETNPISSAIGEIGGFGAGLATDLGLPSMLGKAGEAAAHVVGLAEPVTISSKLAKGAATAATEMGLYQANDEATRAILDAPNSPGTIATNIGLSAMLGGATGPMFTGAGLLVKNTLDQPVLKDFVDRLAFRKANPDPSEAVMSEAENAYNTYRSMGSEVGGAEGLKAQALSKLMPDMSPVIQDQIPKTVDSLEKAALEMEARPFKFGTRIPGLIREGIDDFNEVVQDAQSPGQIFDALNDLKKEFDSSIPKNLTPDNDNYHAFRKLQDVTGQIRKSLENEDIWGRDVAGLQKI
jgi:hypothetical protein